VRTSSERIHLRPGGLDRGRCGNRDVLAACRTVPGWCPPPPAAQGRTVAGHAGQAARAAGDAPGPGPGSRRKITGSVPCIRLVPGGGSPGKGAMRRIRDSRNQVPGLTRPRSRAVAGYAVSVWLPLVLLSSLRRPAGVPAAALSSLVPGAAAPVHIGWVPVRRPCRPSPPPEAAGPGAQRRRDLLDAAEKHGASAPEHARPRPRSPGTTPREAHPTRRPPSGQTRA
jgi:hypothetical protein